MRFNLLSWSQNSETQTPSALNPEAQSQNLKTADSFKTKPLACQMGSSDVCPEDTGHLHLKPHNGNKIKRLLLEQFSMRV